MRHYAGLCQAKIAAAELWRKYSENYRSHQARHMPPGSSTSVRRHQRATNVNEQPEESPRFRQNIGGSHQQGRRQLDYCNSPNFDDDDDAPSRASGADKWDDERLDVDETELATTGSRTFLAKSRCLKGNVGMRITAEKNFDEQETDRLDERADTRNDASDEVNDLGSRAKNDERRFRPGVNVESAADDDDSSSRPENDKSPAAIDDVAIGLKQLAKRDVIAGTPTAAEAKSGGSVVVDREQNNNVVGLKMPLLGDAVKSENAQRPSSFGDVTSDEDTEDLRKRPPVLDAVVAMSSALFDSQEHARDGARDVTAKLAEVVLSATRLDDAVIGSGPMPSRLAKRSSSSYSSVTAHHHQRQQIRKATELSLTSGGTSPTTAAAAADYRRSERGLSFLFPSFADHHGMSLIDKVRRYYTL